MPWILPLARTAAQVEGNRDGGPTALPREASRAGDDRFAGRYVMATEEDGTGHYTGLYERARIERIGTREFLVGVGVFVESAA